MDLPQGRLLRKRVLKEVETVLTGALEQQLTGYARLEPQDTLLLDGQGVGVLTFEDGIPVGAYHTETENEGPEALTEIASSGPYRLELYELDKSVVDRIHKRDSLVVTPDLPAKRLTGNSELVERTKELAPEERVPENPTESSSLEAVEEFLEDDEKIESIRDRARNEAQSRADEWGFHTE